MSLQRLAQRTWWVQAFNYGTIFHVGDRGVLIFDTLEGVYDGISQAIRSVTDKPVIAAVYPHYHADHIGDIAKYVDAAKSQGVAFQIIGSTKTRDSMNLANSSFPRPTQLLAWPHDSFDFDGLTVELHGFEWAAHSDDHSAWLLKQDRILHSPDLINPDQPPFWRFAGNERFRFHEDNLKQIYDLEWDYLSGSHGNIGSRVDIDFQLAFIADLKTAVGKAMGAHPFTSSSTPRRTPTPGSCPTSLPQSRVRLPTLCARSTGNSTASNTRRRPMRRWLRGRCSNIGSPLAVTTSAGGTTMRIRALVVERKDAPFDDQEIELGEPGRGEVLVRIVASGVCHTDAITRAGDMGMPFPAVLGHEGAGVVEKLGEGVSQVTVGDQVIIGWPSCGECRNCLDGQPRYCLRTGDALVSGRRFKGELRGTTAYSRNGQPLNGHFFGQSSFGTYSIASADAVSRSVRTSPSTCWGHLPAGSRQAPVRS